MRGLIDDNSFTNQHSLVALEVSKETSCLWFESPKCVRHVLLGNTSWPTSPLLGIFLSATVMPLAFAKNNVRLMSLQLSIMPIWYLYTGTDLARVLY